MQLLSTIVAIDHFDIFMPSYLIRCHQSRQIFRFWLSELTGILFLLKAAIRKFCLFVAISVWNLQLQLLVELFLLPGMCSGVVLNSDPRQIITPLVLVGLGLGVGEGLGLGNQIAISTRG